MMRLLDSSKKRWYCRSRGRTLGRLILWEGQMSVLTVAGQKGGSGKSTLVRNLAIHFALDGYKVGIVDADLIQQHSSEFFADRTREAGREVWTGREDIPGLPVKVWDRSSQQVPDAPIVIAPQADQD